MQFLPSTQSNMADAVTVSSTQTARPFAGGVERAPFWASTALVASGVVLIVLETASMLFFLGILFLMVGGVAMLDRRKTRASPPAP
jgi:uncharacterized membrane protein